MNLPKYDAIRTSYPCVAVYEGVRCEGDTHLKDDLFICDTCSHAWDGVTGEPQGKQP